MIRFLIYLFESGMCLTLLFLVYYLFLRKETYFTFNRIYLISILIFSLLFPLVHLNISLPKSNVLENQVKEISKFKSYYENIIALTDPDYLQSFTKPFQEKEMDEFDEMEGVTFSSQNSTILNTLSEENIRNKKTGFWANLHFARILLILYLLGILFFAVRLISLFKWINQTIKKYGSTNENGVIMVKMDEEVPPFSFFRFVFLNREAVSLSGFGQIVAHEKVHINQHHSLDLLLAHAITIFQWFNPFVWLINNAMKTNHEYIADRNVVEQGYELFDYQSLLLKQIISIRSVELVNNFNLINIKKRIAMMTKIKSGLAAQIKALIVIPAAIFIFFFFAEITFAQSTLGWDSKDLTKELQGFWKNVDDNTYGEILNFKGSKLQILESVDTYRELEIQFLIGRVASDREAYYETEISKYAKDINELTASFHTLPLVPHKSKLIPLILKEDKLIMSWGPDKVSIYNKVKGNSSLACFSKSIYEDFEPTSTSYYRISENPEKTFFLFMNKDGQMFLDGEQIESTKLIEKIKEVKQKGNPFGADEKVPIIAVDARCEMAYVNVLYRKLREMDELRHILSVNPLDKKVPEIFYHNVGIPRLLSPKDAKLMDEDEVEKSRIKIIRVDLTEGITPEIAAAIFENEIQKDKKFVAFFYYENATTYKEYLLILDEFYQIIFAKRDELALEKYNLGYDDLAKTQQKEIRKSYPMVITERNIDYQPY